MNIAHRLPTTKKSLWVATLIVALCGFGISALPAAVQAQGDPIPEKTTCTIDGKPGVSTSFSFFGGKRCIEIGNTFLTNPITQVLLAFVGFLAGGVVIAVTGGFVWGGFLYMTARGNSAQTEKAISVITHAALGLVLFIFMFAILNFIIPGGVFA